MPIVKADNYFERNNGFCQVSNGRFLKTAANLSALVLVLATIFAPLEPLSASVVTAHCGAGTHTPTGKCRVFLTSGTSWTVPSDWNSSNNTIEVIGGGGGGSWGDASWSGPGGGGGAYSKATNVSYTPGNVITVQVGSGGSGGTTGSHSGGTGTDTFIKNNSNSANVALAKAGTGGTYNASNGGAAGSGGSSGSGTGSTIKSGGNGGAAGGNSGGGGGGAGGINGDGAAGAQGGAGSILTAGGSGGGGSGGGTPGTQAASGGTNGGAGGNNASGSGGGSGGGAATNGSAGTNGGGGGGGGAGGSTGVAAGNGGSGGAGTEWDLSHGSGGGGGGGGAGASVVPGTGGAGALYGGGGAGAGGANGGSSNGGNGAQGIIVITYTPQTHIAHSNTVALSNGLVAYWTFDGSQTNWTTGKTLDSSGNGKTGQLIKMSTSTSPVAGKIGGALKFDGVSSQVTFSGLTTGTTWTYAAWVKPDASQSSSNGDLITQDNAFGVTYRGTGAGGNAGRVAFIWVGGFTNSNSTLKNGAWNFVVVTIGGGNVTIYLNGKFDSTVAGGSSMTLDSMGNDIQSETFKGQIDDARVYNRALSAQEVAQLYAQGAANIAHSNTVALSNGLVGYWTFDGSQTNWTTGQTSDSSGNGNTGQLIKMSTSTSPVAGKIGQALNFTGQGTISIANNAALTSSGKISVSFWEEFTVTNGQFMVLSNDDTSTGFYINKNFNGGGTPNEITIILRNGSPSGRLDTAVTLDDGKWHHVVYTYDGTVVKCYVDGAFRSSLVTSVTISSTVPFTIAGGITLNRFKGNLDDMRIYNRALSAQEVAQLYKMGAQ